jgi:large repetitive protein
MPWNGPSTSSLFRADVSCMDLFPRSNRMRVFHGCLRRALAGAVGAGLLVLAIPVPSMAARTPSVTITDVTVTEGTGGTPNANFTIQATPAPRLCCAIQVSWATASVSATAPADFTSSSGTVSLTNNSASKVVSVPVVGDALNEANETFVVNLSNLVGSPGKIGDAQGVATITDDDPTPVLSVNDVSVTEGNAGTTTMTFTATLSAASGKTVTFDWATAAGSATQGVDYVAATGSGTIAAGSTGTSIGVTVNGDVLDEPNETFGMTLSNAVNATIGDGSGIGTITDDDPIPLLSVNDVSVTEGDAGTTIATFTVTLSAASGQTVTVDWATLDGSATQPNDYVVGSGTLTFPAGTTIRTIGVTVIGETVPELDEIFRVTLSNATNAVIGDAVGVGTILDDELEAVIDIDDPTVIEEDTGTTTLAFGLTLSNPSDSTVTVDWATSDGTATAGSDYLGESGTVTFAPSDTSETVQVTVYGDTTYEPDETVALHLSNPTNAPIGKAQAIGTILNDDKAPTSLTLRVVRQPHAVVAKGLLEPATSGEHVGVTLFRKQGGRFVKLAAKTVPVRYLKDRDGDGKTDGSYTATFTRPKAKGTYKILVRFKGTATYKPRSLAAVFTLSAS